MHPQTRKPDLLLGRQRCDQPSRLSSPVHELVGDRLNVEEFLDRFDNHGWIKRLAGMHVQENPAVCIDKMRDDSGQVQAMALAMLRSMPKRNDILVVQKRSHAFFIDGSLKFSESILVTSE